MEKLPDEHRTGDLGTIDADGHVVVVGRLKDLIIRGGVNISPVELDNVLSRHPDIVDAAIDGFIRPSYRTFHQSTSALSKAGKSLCAAPSQSALDAARNAFGATVDAWSRIG